MLKQLIVAPTTKLHVAEKGRITTVPSSAIYSTAVLNDHFWGSYRYLMIGLYILFTCESISCSRICIS